MFRLLPALSLGLLLGATAARAEVPFYGFSGYYGGPATYYTHDTDVHAATTLRDGKYGFGIRTFKAGGPFWGYRPAHRPVSLKHYPRRREALRSRG